jgi:ribosomal protein S18 acetylase RimI-like enzyme
VIRAAQAEDIAPVRVLFGEYAEWVGDHICFPAFEREMAELPGLYAPPDGRLLIAFRDDRLAGCVALRKFDAGVGEMKRLYVRPEFRDAGMGPSLVARIIEEARGAGYQLLRLDTLPRMERAVALYRAFGFQEIERHGDNPESAICFELVLRNTTDAAASNIQSTSVAPASRTCSEGQTQ